jgi:hypothetical protein
MKRPTRSSKDTRRLSLRLWVQSESRWLIVARSKSSGKETFPMMESRMLFSPSCSQLRAVLRL